MITSRGCPGKCNFCSSPTFWKFARYRSPNDVIKEMRFLIEEYGAEEIQIEDDNMTGWGDRAKEIFRQMKSLGIVWCAPNGVRINSIDEEMMQLMKDSGCYRLTYAIESGNEQLRTGYIKKPYKNKDIKMIVNLTKKYDIGLHTYWIIGFPNETRQQIQETYNFAKELNSDSASFCLATPMIGTQLLKTCKEQDLLNGSFDVRNANYLQSNIINPNIKSEELEALVYKFNSSYNKRLLLRNPIKFFKKYGETILKNPKGLLSIFKKFA